MGMTSPEFRIFSACLCQNWGWYGCFLTIVIFMAGCDSSASTETSDLELDFGDSSEVAKDMGMSTGSQTSATDLSNGIAQAPAAPALASEKLDLRVKVGDRFPLLKTVDQRVSQGTPSQVVGTSRLELQLVLQVDEIQADRTRFSVQYHRVQFQQNLGGKSISYNSAENAAAIPQEAVAYAGLPGNGFGFWLGPDRRVAEVLGFEEFVQRCVAHVPAERKAHVIGQLAVLPHDEGVANFIDNSIGLLPARGAQEVTVGSTWVLPPKRTDGPIPLTLETRCLVKDLGPREVVIDVVGAYAPSSAQYGPQGIKVSVRGGRQAGDCRVDRATGLPTSSRLTSVLDMLVQTADGREMQQVKETITSIQSFPDQSSLQAQSQLVNPMSSSPSLGMNTILQTGHAQSTTAAPTGGANAAQPPVSNSSGWPRDR
jgi:hypothetical protein